MYFNQPPVAQRCAIPAVLPIETDGLRDIPMCGIGRFRCFDICCPKSSKDGGHHADFRRSSCKQCDRRNAVVMAGDAAWQRG